MSTELQQYHMPIYGSKFEPRIDAKRAAGWGDTPIDCCAGQLGASNARVSLMKGDKEGYPAPLPVVHVVLANDQLFARTYKRRANNNSRRRLRDGAGVLFNSSRWRGLTSGFVQRAERTSHQLVGEIERHQQPRVAKKKNRKTVGAGSNILHEVPYATLPRWAGLHNQQAQTQHTQTQTHTQKTQNKSGR